MKQPKIKVHKANCENGTNFYYLVNRATKIKRTPDLAVDSFDEHKNEFTVSLWFGKDWKCLDSSVPIEEGGLRHVMECPRSGLLMFSSSEEGAVDISYEDYCKVSNPRLVTSAWAYFSNKVQEAYREYRATWELEEAMLNTK